MSQPSLQPSLSHHYLIETELFDKDFYATIELLHNKEHQGLWYLKRGNYQKAFDGLSYAAIRGLKMPQYQLSLMFLKGDHVKPSLIQGMAWLGVAKEGGTNDWLELFDKLYEDLTLNQKRLIDIKVAEYIKKYGEKTQNVSCKRMQKRKLHCTKADGRYPIYPIQF